MTVQQWLPAARRGDAVGDSARLMQALLRAQGHASEIFALEIEPDLRRDVRPFRGHAEAGGDVTLLHFATPSPLTGALGRLRHGRVVQYHNVTPPRFFAPFSPELAALSACARRELRALCDAADLAAGPSEFNRRELEALGFAETRVLPLAVDVGRLRDAPPHPVMDRWLRDGRVNLLFVGRVAPNKKVEDLLRLAARYRRRVDPDARLVVAGRDDSVPRYAEFLRLLAARLGLGADALVFTGALSDAALAACYRAAGAYVSMSEHEGFCAPLVEAMAMDVPILAYAGAAVPETLGGAGVAFAPKDLDCAAEALGLLVHDARFRASVIEGQRRRLAHFEIGRVGDALRRIVERFT
ncbi:MAG TPA: glycosyltransferase [Vicinamibacterales bacterium]|nr:glycosyltransferase [Vicinamibacterales bacterium]HPW19673.1 glycosyltransferase [Vicinamibacterales bacterium]